MSAFEFLSKLARKYGLYVANIGRSRPPPTRRSNSKSKSRVKSLAMARLAKKESEWKGKLGFSSRSTKAEVRAK